MAKDVRVPAGQPVITTRPKRGQPVTTDQFSMDFTVEVDDEACYVIDVVLMEHRFGPITDDVVLSNANAFVQPYCLSAGSHDFRVTTSAPGPPGSTPAPAPPSGTINLPPIDGKWPDHISSSLELYYTITVYRIGPCTAGAPATCATMARSDLGKYSPHMSVEGPNTGGASPIQKPVERTLVALASDQLHKEGRSTESGLMAQREPTPPITVTEGGVSYLMQRVNDARTLYREGVWIERLEREGSRRPRKTLEFAVLDRFPELAGLGRSLHLLERAQTMTPALMVVRAAIQRHGRMTFHDAERVRSTYFVDDTAVMVWYEGTGPDWPPVLADEGRSVVMPLADVEEVDVTIGVKDTADDHWWFSWAENGFSFLNPAIDYAKSVQDIVDILHNVAIHAPDRCIKKLHILSHGYATHAGSGSGTVTGSGIDLGGGTAADPAANDIRSDQFDGAGNPVAGSNVDKLINELKRAMCPHGKIVFSACDQGVGGMLQNISKAIDNDITVNGFSGTGNPLTEGDMNFKDGVKQ